MNSTMQGKKINPGGPPMPKEIGKKVAHIDTRNKYEKSIEHMKEMLPYVIEEWEIKAKFLKRKHELLIAQGFTEEQALEIVKSRPIFE